MFQQYQLHHNVKINNDTPFEDYYLSVEDHLNSNYEEELYASDTIATFEVWDIRVKPLSLKHLLPVPKGRNLNTWNYYFSSCLLSHYVYWEHCFY